jgi:hypothetical protein
VPVHENPDRADTVENAAVGEMLRLIDERLAPDLRRSYRQLRAGLPVSKTNKEAVQKAVQDILGADAL